MMFIGTTNTDKVAEIGGLLQSLGVVLTPVALNVPEIYDTFKDNSTLKAMEYAKHVGGVCISEDSGLEVQALNNMPGPWSARYYHHNNPDLFDPNLSRKQIDDLNNKLVLKQMLGEENRTARFVIYLTVASPDRVLFQNFAYYQGYIAQEEKGSNGFGYDPIFIGHDTYGKTLAELDSVRKNIKSHRKMVLDSLYAWASENPSLL